MKLRHLSALLVVFALAGCGGHAKRAAQPPRLPSLLASRLAAQSDLVAQRLDAGDSCAALTDARDLRQRTIAAIQHGRVPAPLQEELLGTVQSLEARIVCVPPPKPNKGEEDNKGRDHGHGGGEGKG